MTDPLQALMYQSLQIKEEINEITSSLKVSDMLFSVTSLQLPKFTPSELGFIRMVSWLYVHYYEAGKIGAEYLTDLAPRFLGGSDNVPKNHRVLIQQLRTYCQHNLAPQEQHSKIILLACENWFFLHSGSKRPGNEEHWSKLLNALIAESLIYFRYLRDSLRSIESDADNSQLLEQWSLRINRYYPPHKFDRIIEEVANDFGKDAIDAIRFRSRHYDRWRKELELMRYDCDYDREARALVEAAFLADQQPRLPINGRDVMSSFDIPPGPRVQEVLAIALDIYRSSPCTKEELIAHLTQRLSAG